MEIRNRTPEASDELEISRILLSTPNNGESFEKDVHLNDFIEKPWGFEYRIYCDSIFDVWKLHISENESTSMHCHIQKDTVLICLEGSGRTQFLDGNQYHLRPGESIYINKGVFHQTTAGDSGIELLEIENPRNKFDLLRLQDKYGRQNTAYEKKSQLHDLLAPLEQIGPGVFLRTHDIHNLVSFKISKLNNNETNENKNSIFVALDIKYHLSGKIHILNTKDTLAENYYGQNVLLIIKN